METKYSIPSHGNYGICSLKHIRELRILHVFYLGLFQRLLDGAANRLLGIHSLLAGDLILKQLYFLWSLLEKDIDLWT